MDTKEFRSYGKIARYSREVIVTEKIDGTNAQIYIGEDGEFLTGSRKRWITPDDDNFGFSRWAHDHKDELMQLGVGRHFGEWWGSGIQRKYGLTNGERRFSLFNVGRWVECGQEPKVRSISHTGEVSMQEVLPPCCRLVPVLWRGNMDDLDPTGILKGLAESGSHAEYGYMNPEGIVIFHVASGYLFKKTIHGDDKPKGAQ